MSTVTAEQSARPTCVLCKTNFDDQVLYGKLCTVESVTAHHYCLLFASALHQQGRDDEGIMGFLISDIMKEVKRGQKLMCNGCNKTGATIGCCVKTCKQKFHYPCGLANEMVSQFFGVFSSYCKRHKPVQRVSTQGYSAARAEKDKLTATCLICLEDIPARVSYDVLWAPCCSKQSWFHRRCIQALALNAGYFFKCPLCSNNSVFWDEMRRMGIYLPEQDASWELEPNAFQELTERHSTCDATPCVCPKGKEHDAEGTRWELLLCSSCGSRGTHIGCGRLPWGTDEWSCSDCDVATRDVKPRKLRPLPPVAKPTPVSVPEDSDDSDIDVVNIIPPKKSRHGEGESSSGCVGQSSSFAGTARSGHSSFATPSPSSGSGGTRRTCDFEQYRFRVISDNKLLVYIEGDSGPLYAGTVILNDPVSNRSIIPKESSSVDAPPEARRPKKR